MNKPKLKENAPIGVTLFSGGGGIETGLVEAGIRPGASVDCDPMDESFSRQIQFCRDRNFERYGNRSYLATVEEMAERNFPDIPREPFILHASPVCSSFSNLGNFRGIKERPLDISAAIATSQAISVLKPQWFTLENVTGYQGSDSLLSITQTLTEQGYYCKIYSIDFADYGIPQNRKRIILVAHRSRSVEDILPPKSPVKSWAFCLEGLPLTEPEDLTDKQLKALMLNSLKRRFESAIIQRAGGGKIPTLRTDTETCWTITKSVFKDQKGSGRGGAITYWDNTTRQAFRLPMRAIARICGFPDWYELPEIPSLAGSILGLSVPPSFAQQLFQQILKVR